MSHLHAALSQTWPPFVLVTALLAVGQVAGADGLFEAAASRLVRLPGPPVALLLACLGLVMLVTAFLNLDTSAVFLTPVLIGVARRRGLQVAPFLYGAIFMANASSLFLPGSNLTNLLVLDGGHGGGSFFTTMLAPALLAPLITAVGLVVIHRRALAGSGSHPHDDLAPIRVGAGLLGASAAAVLMVALANPALPVLGVALVLVLWRAFDGYGLARSVAALGLPALFGLFGLSLALGLAARAGALPADLLRGVGAPATAAVAALASIAVNNLPAAVLLSSHGTDQPQALLLGLNLGPNLAVTGSLAVLLWWRAARAAGLRPSALDYSRQGLILAPLAILAGLLVGSG
jgi:arsenical pump membrane protein